MLLLSYDTNILCLEFIFRNVAVHFPKIVIACRIVTIVFDICFRKWIYMHHAEVSHGSWFYKQIIYVQCDLTYPTYKTFHSHVMVQFLIKDIRQKTLTPTFFLRNTQLKTMIAFVMNVPRRHDISADSDVEWHKFTHCDYSNVKVPLSCFA